MILAETFKAEWINSFKKTKEFKRINPPVFEKMIFAFGLLEKLAEAGFEFIFKGGTSLLLLLDNFQRFSTDIDVISTKSIEELEDALSEIVAASLFTGFELKKRSSKSGNIPKAHYNIGFQSAFHENAFIVLDVLIEENPYPVLVESEIKNRWLQTEEPVIKVLTPDINSILGDKLTAFAPSTIGVPYFRGSNSMSTEIIKQLFDINILIHHVSSIEIAHQSYINNCQNQLKYRSLNVSIDAVHQDVFNTSLILAKRERNDGHEDKSNFKELQNGIISFNSFLANGNFRIEEAISASAKAIWLTTIFRTQSFDKFILYDSKIELNTLEILNVSFNFLNRFKKTNKEAFYYWYKTLELMKLIK